MRRNGIEEVEIKKRVGKANDAFPDALVENYEPLTTFLDLPDENDRHVLAAAIKTNANIIVTNNIRDFPAEYLSRFGLAVKTADDFLTDTIDLNIEIAVQAFKTMVKHRRAPILSDYDMLDRLRNNGLYNTANLLHSQL